MPLETLGELHKGEREKKENEIEKEPRYNFEAIKELEEPMIDLVSELKESIDRGDYDTLLSDDASARLPTLVLRKVLQARMRKFNHDLTPEEDRKMLKTFFIAGGIGMKNNSAIKEFLEKIKPDVKKKVFLITEYIHSGDSIARIADILEDAGILFDIASVTSNDKKESYKNITLKHGLARLLGTRKSFLDKLSVGKENAPIPLIYGERKLMGVRKERGQEGAHPKPYIEEYLESSKNLMKSLADVNTMADVILKRVWGEK